MRALGTLFPLAVLAALGCGGARPTRKAPLPTPTCGVLRAGLRDDAVAAARGRPTLFWNTTFAGQSCRVLLYGSGRALGRVDLAIYDCEGPTYEAAIEPPLPCWRLADVAPRIVEASDYFARQALERQWEIVAGIPSTGQTPGDVHIAFGDPYTARYRAGEHGEEVQTQVFVDRSGESFALDVTLVDRAVAGWHVRVERELVPEVEALRLRAVREGRAPSVEAAAKAALRRHQETVEYLTQLIDGREAMRKSLVEPSKL